MITSLADRERVADHHILIPHGAPGLKRNAGYIDEEFHSKLKGKTGQKMFREMADNSPVIAASLWIIESLLRQVSWEAEENESGHPLSGWGSEFVEQLFSDMETPWRSTIGEILSFLVFGHSVFEPEYKLRRGDTGEPLTQSDHSDGLIGWRDIANRPQESIDRWVFDSTGRLIGAIQRDPTDGQLYGLPLDRILLFRVRARKNNPEGYPLLRPAYPSYYYAKRLSDIEAIGIERNIAGMPDYQIPAECFGANATADQIAARNAALDFVKKIRVDAYYGAVRPTELDREGKPTGFKFQLLSSSGKSFADTSPIITRHETRAAQVFMTEFMMAGTQGAPGSYALHSDKTGLLAMACGAMLETVSDVIQQSALPRIWKINNLPREAMPKWKRGDIEKQQILETFQALTTAISAGAVEGDEAIEGFLRKLVNAPPKDGPGIGRAIQQAAVADLGEIQSEPEQPEQDPIDITDPAMRGTYSDPGGDSEKWITVEEAAEEFRVSRSVLRGAVMRGQIPGMRIGRTFRIRRDKIEQMLSGANGQEPIG